MAVNSVTLLSNISLDMSPGTRKTNKKKPKWNDIKLKGFCTAQETINKKEKMTH